MCTTVVRLKLPCLWEKPQKRVFLDVSEDVRGGHGTLCHSMCFRRNVCARPS